MSRKASLQDTDGVTWTTAGLPLGSAGLDLRRPDDPGTMSKLLNARFLDQKTLVRRDGHTGRIVQDRGDFVVAKTVTSDWVYGHGTRIVIDGNSNWQNEHHPIQKRGGGTFSFNETDVAWTGDRMLVVTDDGPGYGTSTHWGRNGSTTAVPNGIPAFLPVQVDTIPPDAISGDYVDTAITETQRVVVHSTSDNRVSSVVTNRSTGMVVFRGNVDSGGATPIDVRVINSGGVFLVFWRGTAGLNVSAWTGVAWAEPSVIELNAVAFDVCAVPGGCHLVYRVGAALHVAQFAAGNEVSSPYVYKATLSKNGTTPNGPVAISVDLGGSLAVAWASTTGLHCLTYSSSLVTNTATQLQLSASVDPFNRGLSVCHRGLANEDGLYSFVVHAGQVDAGVQIYEVVADASPATLMRSDTLYNTAMVTHSFRVGDEVFCWMEATNSSTTYLAAGVFKPNVCGIADRETTITRAVDTDCYGIAGVSTDPLEPNGSLLTWIRPYNAGSYTHPGNALIGDMNFLPPLSIAAYGKSVYVAGSHCRNWDGKELGDAGFHDYPVGSNVNSTGAGSLPTTYYYQFRIYAVRYNAAGERFQGVAITSDIIHLTGTQNTITLTIKTIPCTNHDDVRFEVYRTEGGASAPGAAFYLDGTVGNDRDAAAVTYEVVKSDVDLLADSIVDPHATTTGGLTELEESGPLGCATLITACDRLWGIGGQVPAGVAQYSKLYSVGEGVGFDALAGTQIIDATGGALTSIGSFGDARLVAFQANQIFILTGDGPNNFSGDTGSFGVPQVTIVDGAVNHTGTITAAGGLAFWGAGGPRVLTPSMTVVPISEPILSLTETMEPTGVRVDLARREVVWYTAEGPGVLWNYANGSRWAEWSGLKIAGCSGRRLITTAGRLLTPASTPRDDGSRFAFTFATGNIRPEQLLASHTLVRAIGFSGLYNGLHRPQFKVYYNGSRLWSEKFRWEPATDTWLSAGTEFEDLTPAQIDALAPTDRSGCYSTHKRLKREDCRYLRVEVSDAGDDGFTPWELSFELGQKPGLGRTAVNTFTE